MDLAAVGSYALTSATEYFGSGASFTQSTKLINTVHVLYITFVTSPLYDFPITADSYPLEQADTTILLQNNDLS